MAYTRSAQLQIHVADRRSHRDSFHHLSFSSFRMFCADASRVDRCAQIDRTCSQQPVALLARSLGPKQHGDKDRFCRSSFPRPPSVQLTHHAKRLSLRGNIATCIPRVGKTKKPDLIQAGGRSDATQHQRVRPSRLRIVWGRHIGGWGATGR